MTAKTPRKAIVTQANRLSYLMTDEAAVSEKIGREFSGHGTVNHSKDEYVRLGRFLHTNTVESFFALFKRRPRTIHISEAHLFRYLAEADLKYSHRKARHCLIMQGKNYDSCYQPSPKFTAEKN